MTSSSPRPRFVGGWSLLIASLLFLLSGPRAAAQDAATLTGTVVDAQDDTPLPGANVALRMPDASTVLQGTSTGTDGTFRFATVEPGAYVIEVRFVGYRAQERTVTLEAGESRDLDVALQPATQSLETIVVSASRRQEKVLDAPASISVLEPEQIEREVSTSSIEAIRSTPGVDMAQTGLDRREVTLRGFNDAFTGATYVLTDYRQAAVPSLGVNVYSIMPNMSIDVERIEVVRGPGSALYGPGVSNGVIHFFTKDPFQNPGTSASVAGGTRALFSGQFRHAGTIGERLGYKVTGQFARGDEWGLNPSVVDPNEIDDIQSDPNRTLDPDSREVSRYRVFGSRPEDRRVYEIDQDGDGEPDRFRLRREDIYRKFNANGMLQYRADEATVSLNGGYGQITSPVQSGIGTLQPNGFGYSYGQLRVEAGNLFAQGYVNTNFDGGDTYVYGSNRTIVDQSVQWNAQVQYDFRVDPIGTQVIAGADADLTQPRTDGEILGRNEGDDHINEYGGYAQSTTDLTSRLTLTLAGRLDYNNIIEEVRVSPRAALVFKPTSNHTLRGSFNQSLSSPGTNSNFLDIEAQRQPLGNDKDLVFQGRGAADGFTFDQFQNDGAVQFSLPVDPFFKEQYSVDALPVAPMYAAVAGATVTAGGSFTPEVAAQLPDGLSNQQRTLLAQFFGLTAQAAQSQNLLEANQSLNQTGAVQLGIPDDSEKGFRAVDSAPDISPLEQTTTQTFEVGYKGVLADRVLVNVDGYYERKEDFISPLRIESPLAYLQGGELTRDVLPALRQAYQNLPNNPPELSLIVNSLENSGIPRDSAATLLSGLVGRGLNQTPAAVVQPDQEVLPGGGGSDEVGGFLSYRNFGTVEYWGVDASVQVQATEQLETFGNVSVVSDDFFDNEELDEANTDLNVALNAPTFKARGGFDYRFDDAGVTVGATGHYVDGFPVRSGPYVGEVEPYFLLDLRAGYSVPFTAGLRFDVTAKNVLDNEHREFVGGPELGLMLMGRLTYELP